MEARSSAEDRKMLARGRNVWRLCAAAEWAFAKYGKDTTAAHIISAAGMSRRSFYEFFRSVEHLFARLTWAADQFDQTETGTIYCDMVCPSADFMLVALPLEVVKKRDMSGTDFLLAFQARAKRVEAGPEPIPSHDGFLLWYADTVLSG